MTASTPVTASTTVLKASFTVRAGEFSLDADLCAPSGITVFFGSSGSGKSLTLATIAGLRRPDSGAVVIQGATVADAATGVHMRTQDRRVGVVFQDSLLLPHRRVVDNVALAVRPGSKVERRTRALQLLELTGASQLSQAWPTRLSGGERQRCALARAIAGEPRLLLLDEPFSALDFRTRRELRVVLRDLVRTTGIPALLVTHDLDEAAELADHTVVFRQGRTEPIVAGFPSGAL